MHLVVLVSPHLSVLGFDLAVAFAVRVYREIVADLEALAGEMHPDAEAGADIKADEIVGGKTAFGAGGSWRPFVGAAVDRAQAHPARLDDDNLHQTGVTSFASFGTHLNIATVAGLEACDGKDLESGF
jgi:hypothetical protein